MLKPKISPVQYIDLPLLHQKRIRLAVKREDLLHPHISGNKYRKLFYNLIEAKKQNHRTLLTFGGAYSNHIAATAAAGKELGFKTVGVIRGEELASRPDLIKENPTLSFAASQGMEFLFISREKYRHRENKEFLSELKEKFGRFYLVPQGGTNMFGVKGAMEILTREDQQYDYITVAVGTGGTIAGIIEASATHQTVLGFPALKENFLHREISKYTAKTNWKLIRDYHFGGFAKIQPGLIEFINRFYAQTQISFDPVYTGKMLFGLMDLIEKNFFPGGSKILAVHTGGLQGIDGMNRRLQKKNRPLIEIPSFY